MSDLINMLILLIGAAPFLIMIGRGQARKKEEAKKNEDHRKTMERAAGASVSDDDADNLERLRRRGL